MKKTIMKLSIFFLLAVLFLFSMNSYAKAAETSATEDGFKFICDYYKKTAQIVSYLGDEENLVFPSELDGCKVTAIKSKEGVYTAGFYKNYESVILKKDKVKSIVIPDTVEEIGMNAFSECSNLQKVTMSKNLKILGGFAFGNCQSLETISLPATLEKFTSSYGHSYNGRTTAYGAFEGCKSLKEVIIHPDSKIKSVPDDAFRDCSSLEKISLSNSIEEISSSSFLACTSLTSFKMPINLKVIEDNSFNGCTNLSEIKWNEGLDRISGWAFANTAIEKLVLPSTITRIGNDAFHGCKRLSSVTFGSGPEELSSGLFYDCVNLSTVSLNEGLLTIRNDVFKNTGLTTIIIPSTVVKIGSSSFKECSSLKKAFFLGTPEMNGFVSGMRTTLYGFKDSVVQEYAKNLGLGFEALDRPTAFKATNNSYKYAKLTWKAVKGIDKYTIYRSTSKDGTYKKIKTVSTNSYNDKSIKHGKTYYYYVTIKYEDNDGVVLNGIKSDIAEVKFSPKDVTGFSADYRYYSKKVTFSWDRTTDASGYVLYYRDDLSAKWTKVKGFSSKTSSYTHKLKSSFSFRQYAIRSYKTVNGKNVYSDYIIKLVKK